MLSSSAVRGLGLSVLASSALTLALGSPTQAAPLAAPTSVASSSAVASVAVAQAQPATAKKLSGAAKKKAARKKALARKKAYRKAHSKAVRKARKVGTYRVDRTLVDHRIDSSSGLARSTYKRSVLFTHNDDRDGARLFALDGAGRTRAVIKVKGASARDWEDVAAGPRHSLWVADTGDSAQRRGTVVVHRLTEPKKLPKGGRTIKVRPQTYRFTFPDGARNVEALLVHPRTGRLHLVSRDSSGGTVYAAPATLSTRRANKLTAVAAAPADVTAGSWSPDGRTLMLGTRTKAYTFAAVGGAATVTALPSRRNGSSLEVSRSGKLLVGGEGRYSSVLRLALPGHPRTTPAPAGPTSPTSPTGPTQRPAPAPTVWTPPAVTPAPTAQPAPTSKTTPQPSMPVTTSAPAPTSTLTPAPTRTATPAPGQTAAPTAAPAPTSTNTPAPTAAPTATPVGSCKAPAYSSTKTLFGASLSASDGNLQQALATNDALFGKLPVVRQFDPTVPPKGAWSRRTFFNDRTMVVSFREDPKEVVKGTYDAQILDYFRTAPTAKPIFWSYFHEPEPHIANGTFTYAEYRAAWRHVVDLVGTLCRTNLYPTLVLTGWTTEPASKRDWRDYYPGDEYISVVSWDPYNSATGTPTSYPDPAKLYASVLKASKESGKPWGIAETGSALVPGDDGTERAKWLTKVGQYFDDQGAAFVTYFQSTRDGNFKLLDSASVAAWGAWVKKYD